MVKGLDRKIAKLERTITRTEAKVENLKRRHAHALINEARVLMGKSPKPFGGAKSKRAARTAKAAKAETKTNGGDKK